MIIPYQPRLHILGLPFDLVTPLSHIHHIIYRPYDGYTIVAACSYMVSWNIGDDNGAPSLQLSPTLGKVIITATSLTVRAQ